MIKETERVGILFLNGQISIRRSSKGGTDELREEKSVGPSVRLSSAHCHRTNNDFGQETGLTGSGE